MITRMKELNIIVKIIKIIGINMDVRLNFHYLDKLADIEKENQMLIRKIMLMNLNKKSRRTDVSQSFTSP